MACRPAALSPPGGVGSSPQGDVGSWSRASALPPSPSGLLHSFRLVAVTLREPEGRCRSGEVSHRRWGSYVASWGCASTSRPLGCGAAPLRAGGRDAVACLPRSAAAISSRIDASIQHAAPRRPRPVVVAGDAEHQPPFVGEDGHADPHVPAIGMYGKHSAGRLPAAYSRLLGAGNVGRHRVDAVLVACAWRRASRAPAALRARTCGSARRAHHPPRLRRC